MSVQLNLFAHYAKALTYDFSQGQEKKKDQPTKNGLFSPVIQKY